MIVNDENESSNQKNEVVKLCEKGDTENLKTYLKGNKVGDGTIYSILVNFIESDSKIPLNIIEVLLKYMKSVDYQNPSGDNSTILMTVCKKANLQILNLMLGFNSINVNKIDKMGDNSLHKLVKANNNDEAEKLCFTRLMETQIEFDKKNNEGYTPLALALIYGNSSLAEELIKKGAKKDLIIDHTGDSLLHCAVLGKNPKCIGLLNDLDADYKNKEGKAAKDLADRPELRRINQMLGVNSDYKIVPMTDVLNEFKNKNYQEAVNMLNNYSKSNPNDMSLMWNLLICQYALDLENNNLPNESNTANSKLFLTQFKEFFKNFDDNNRNFFNKGVYNMKLGRFKSAFKNFSQALNRFDKNEESASYVNVVASLLSILLELRQLKVASSVLGALDSYIARLQKNGQKSKDISNDYLASREIITGSVEESQIVYNLFKSYKNILDDKLDEASKYTKEYKRIITTSKLKESHPIFNTFKKFYHYLKIRVDYTNNAYYKCYKHLNSLYNNFILQNEKSLSVAESQIFYLNSSGIINLKQKRYNLAEFFFKSCLNYLKTVKNCSDLRYKGNMTSYVKYNIALSYFYQKQFEKAKVLFKQVESKLSYYPFVHYRIGLCNLEMELARKKSKSNSCYNESLQKEINYRERFNIDISVPLHAINPEDQQPISRQPTQEVAANPAKISTKRVILRNESPNVTDNYLDTAIYHFKQTIILLKDNFHFKAEINEINKFFDIEDPTISQQLQSPFISKSSDIILTSSYLNLVFCLTLKKEWDEVLFQTNKAVNNNIYNKDTAYAFDNYRIEACIALNLHGQVLQILRKNMVNNSFSYQHLDFKGNFYSKVNENVYSEVQYKLALYINITKMNFINNNLTEAEKGLQSIINMTNLNFNTNATGPNHNDLPPYLINMLACYYLLKQNYDAVLNLIKWRKMPQQFVPINFQMPANAVKPVK